MCIRDRFVRGKGIMLREPSIVAVDKYTGRMLKVGQDAQKMLGRTPANIVAIHPISAGVISDYDMTALMLKELLSRVTSFSLFKPRVLVTVPSSVTGVEERNVIDAVIEAGARKVYLVESAVATAAMTFTCAEVEELLGRWVVWVTSGVSMSGLSPSWVA